jgi:hypothetical protein
MKNITSAVLATAMSFTAALPAFAEQPACTFKAISYQVTTNDKHAFHYAKLTILYYYNDDVGRVSYHYAAAPGFRVTPANICYDGKTGTLLGLNDPTTCISQKSETGVLLPPIDEIIVTARNGIPVHVTAPKPGSVQRSFLNMGGNFCTTPGDVREAMRDTMAVNPRMPQESTALEWH